MKRIKSALRTALYAIVGGISTTSCFYQLYIIYFMKIWKYSIMNLLWVATTLYCIVMPIIGAFAIYHVIKSYKCDGLQLPALRIGSCLLLLILLIGCLIYHLSISTLLFSNAQFVYFTPFDYFLLIGALSSTVLLFSLDVYFLCSIILSVVKAASNG